MSAETSPIGEGAIIGDGVVIPRGMRVLPHQVVLHTPVHVHMDDVDIYLSREYVQVGSVVKSRTEWLQAPDAVLIKAGCLNPSLARRFIEIQVP